MTLCKWATSALCALVLVIASCSPATPQQDKQPEFPPVSPPIQFPEPTVPPTPPVPSTTVLLAEEYYVVTSEKDMLSWAFPVGILSITKEKGPLRINAKFVGGGGKTETREYTAKVILIVQAAATGNASLLVLPAGATEQKQGIIKQIEANVGPRPPPKPDPKPDDPKPKPPEPGPVPIPDPGFRVLMVYESAEESKLSDGQRQAIRGLEVRKYLDSHCVKGADGKTPERRIYDKDVNLTQETKLWQDAMKRPRTSLPWLIVTDGKTGGYEGPLPPDIPTTWNILKKYGGE